MIKKTITYKDFEGVEHTEDFWFHIPPDKLTELEVSRKGGLSSLLPDIMKAAQDGDAAEVYKLFREIVQYSFGIRTDAAHFEQEEPEIRRFMSSQAFQALWLELATDEKALTEFTVGIMPSEVMERAEARGMVSRSEDGQVTIRLPEEGDQPPWVRENRSPTPAELKTMTNDQLVQAFRDREKRMSEGSQE